MNHRLVLPAIMLGVLLTAPHGAAAVTPQSQTPALTTGQSLVQPAAVSRRCRFWRRECRRRWEFGVRYRNCMILHGCPFVR